MEDVGSQIIMSLQMPRHICAWRREQGSPFGRDRVTRDEVEWDQRRMIDGALCVFGLATTTRFLYSARFEDMAMRR